MSDSSHHDVGLDSLQHTGQEPFTLWDQAIPPHLVGGQAYEVRGEQDLLDGGGVRGIGVGNLETTNKPL